MDTKTINTPTSSNIASYSYSPACGVLRVEFKNGAMWEYERVPESIFDELRKASSVGSFLASRIKGYYDGRKVEE